MSVSFEELAAGATMRAAHRYKLALQQLQADAAARGETRPGPVLATMDAAGVAAIDALASELVGHIERVNAMEQAEDVRARAVELQNLFDNALREGGHALVAARDQTARPVLQRLGVQMPATAMVERLDVCVREQRARILLAVRTTGRPAGAG